MSTRLFVSHSWSYGERYNAMVSLLRNRPYFNFTNYSGAVRRIRTGFDKENEAALYAAPS